MREKRKLQAYARIGKCLLWCAGFIGLLLLCTNILKPKWLFSSKHISPETEIWHTFYEEPRDSIDIIFLGSSHVYNGINPIVFYEETGIRSFSLASSSQDMATSYFYLKEALNYQKPACVVFDAYGFNYQTFSNSATYKRSLDDMRWSAAKCEAVFSWQEQLVGENFTARLFPVMDYHTRWEELTETDFNYRSQITAVNGFIPCFTAAAVSHDLYETQTDEIIFDELTLGYFEKLQKLCKENGIQLVLISTPGKNWYVNYSKAVSKVAEEYGLQYYDFNEQKMYERLALDGATDYRDANHLNTDGAGKFTKGLAALLKERGFLEAVPTAYDNTLWKEKCSTWKKYSAQEELCHTTNLENYLKKLNQTDYMVFLVSHGPETKAMTKKVKKQLKRLGIQNVKELANAQSCIGVYEAGEAIYEAAKSNDEAASIDAQFYDASVQLSAAGGHDISESYFVINDSCYPCKSVGLNFAVYAKETKEVIDVVGFDTAKEGVAFR